jgi:hypothetical protein
MPKNEQNDIVEVVKSGDIKNIQIFHEGSNSLILPSNPKLDQKNKEKEKKPLLPKF